jgi:GrpB-like predicted nucleotidyltransferase (UPF0157 family)
LFAAEAAQIQAVLGEGCVAVEHVGSTSIPGLAAKPVIDILAGVTALTAGEQAVPALEALGYEYRGENGIPGRLFFRKGPVQYRRTQHLHLVKTDHEQWIAMLSFRDYLRANLDEARRYEALKRSLAFQFREDRQAYTEGKAEYIYGVMQKARHQE